MSESPLVAFSDHVANVVAAVAPSVVQVHGRRRPASGVVFREGLVLTTSRALGREDGLHVRTDDGADHEAELAGWDPATGLVLLRVNGLRRTSVAPTRVETRVGHLAIAVGRSWSNAVTATSGLVSVIGGPLPTGPGRSIDRIIRTTAPMHGGFAGGALVDAKGELLGVTTAAEIRGLGVVIPADIAWTTAAALAEHGTLKRGYLGVAGQTVRLPERQREKEGRSEGLLVVGVSSDSPAEAAGVLVGDVVTAFDGRAIGSAEDLLQLLQGDRIGRAVTLRVVRGGTAVDLNVTIGSRAAAR